ncbi:hypothetical protein E2C01_087983 [Portunus trituberculatus]|uniref:Uncharacterized protein n=1 Tax=Portunus trituberculatus TaxID=210409 RepID=A0A5B7J4Y1_PORTR|nr:hypothetical protein [Portunus trituberculatus]
MLVRPRMNRPSMAGGGATSSSDSR